MTDELTELYLRVPRFDEGKIYQSEEYTETARERMNLETLIHRFFGENGSTVLEQYAEVMAQITELECRHFFRARVFSGEARNRCKIKIRRG